LSATAAAQDAEGDEQGGTGFEENDMKASVKAKHPPKRDLIAELSEGMEALAQAREGKRTLRTHAVEFKPAPRVTPAELVRVRERLKLSRALFAVYLRTNVRTLEVTVQAAAGSNCGE
jgi:putative transcriptional regulator